MIFSVFHFFLFLGFLGPPYCGIGATIRIGQEMLCLPYAGFFLLMDNQVSRPPEAEEIEFEITVSPV